MVKIFNNISLKDRNSFHIDITARKLIEFMGVEDLREIFALHAPQEWMVLSGGNNILFTDDIEALVITPKDCGIKIIAENQREVILRVEGGAEWDDVVEWSVANGLWGIENLSLIPGKAGAAPIQNIGAYGVELCDVLQSVEYYDPYADRVEVISADQCGFAYRDSIFKRELKGRVVITSITLKLSRSPRPIVRYADISARIESRGGATLRNIRDEIIAVRESKLPDTKVLGNAGSFFKNPIVALDKVEQLIATYPQMPSYPVEGEPSRRKLAAGWLIEQAGLKGYRQGAVGVHDRQALVLVNHGGASGAQVVELAKYVQRSVENSFGVEIECEVNII